MGWDEDFLQDAVNTCTNPSGQITDCPLFDIQSDADAAQCNITLPSALQSDDVVGPMTSLPGNLAIASGPGYAKATQDGGAPATSAAPTSTSRATLSYSAGKSASSDTFVPGNIFAQQTGKVDNASTSASTAAPATTSTTAEPTTAAPAATTPTESVSFYSTVWETSGNTVKQVYVVEETVTVSVGTTTTITMPAAGASAHAAKHKRHAHHH